MVADFVAWVVWVPVSLAKKVGGGESIKEFGILKVRHIGTEKSFGHKLVGHGGLDAFSWGTERRSERQEDRR